MHALCVAMMLSGTIAFGMEFDLFTKKENSEVQAIVVEEDGFFERIVPRIKDLAQKEERWKKIVDNRWATRRLLHSINNHSIEEFRKKNPNSKSCYDMRDTQYGFDYDIREGFCERFHDEIVAALLGTPGAIAIGKEVIKQSYNDYEAKKRLKKFLFGMLVVGHYSDEGKSLRWRLSWPDEDLDVLKACLAMGFDPNETDDDYVCGYKRTLLQVAVEKDKSNIVKFLLDYGVGIETQSFVSDWSCASWKKDYFGGRAYEFAYTPLHWAALKNSQKAAILLLEGKANVNAIGGLRRTPLISAVLRGYAEMVKLLLAAQADVHVVDGYKKNALMYAQECLKDEYNNKDTYQLIIELLKDAGA